MSKLIFSFLVITSCVAHSKTANILAILPTISPSHHIWNSALVVSLVSKGHNVTVLSPDAHKEPMVNLTDLQLEGVYEGIKEDFPDYEGMSELTSYEWAKAVFDFMGSGCKLAQKTQAVKQLLNYPTDTVFDLIIIESFGAECLFGFISKFGNPPVVVINAFGIQSWAIEMSGTPNILSYMPYPLLPFSDHMTFIERIHNLLIYIYSRYIYLHDFLPHMDKAAKDIFGNHIPSSQTYLQNVSVVLSNFHPAFDYPWAMSPTLIPVGGMQIKDPKPLPKNLQIFLDDAKEGAIFMSLGSNIRSDKLTIEKQRAIIRAFAELPQKVLWKFESDMQNLPKNVKIGKWLPQSDILAHPNIKLFISHSGLLSTHETIHRGVPVIGIPFFSDQHVNIKRLVNWGCGYLLHYHELTKEKLLHAIHKVLGDPSYKKNMRELSVRFCDNPQTPLELAVYWTEYTLRHNGTPHLQIAGKDLNIIQYFLLDVIALLFAVPISVILVCYCICCRRKSKISTTKKQN